MSDLVSASQKSTIVRIPFLGAYRAILRVTSGVSPRLAARMAEVLFRTPPPHRTTDREREVLAGGRRATIWVGERRIAVWRWAQGSPVLLVHGWGSRGSRLHSFVDPLIAAGYCPVAFDAPGHGDSDGRLSSLPQFMTCVRAVAEHVGEPLAGVVAHSMGGAAAVLSMAAGTAARRAVLLAPAANPGAYVETFAAIFGISKEITRRMIANLERRFGYRWDDFSVPAAARRLTGPALVFHDRMDEDVPWEEGEAIANAWPGAELVTTEGLGHRRIVHDPGVVARAIRFLDERGERAAEPAAAGGPG